MSLKRLLQAWFVAALVAMLGVTIYASMDGFSGRTRNVFLGYRDLWSSPWGMATLFDAYFAFIAFWIWVAYKEKRLALKIAWLAAMLFFGNFAIAAYMLIELARLKKGEDIKVLLTRKN